MKKNVDTPQMARSPKDSKNKEGANFYEAVDSQSSIVEGRTSLDGNASILQPSISNKDVKTVNGANLRGSASDAKAIIKGGVELVTEEDYTKPEQIGMAKDVKVKEAYSTKESKKGKKTVPIRPTNANDNTVDNSALIQNDDDDENLQLIVNGEQADGFNPLDIQNQFERSEKGSRDSSSKEMRNVITQTKVTDVNHKMSSSSQKQRAEKLNLNKSKNYSKEAKNQKLSGFEELIRRQKNGMSMSKRMNSMRRSQNTSQEIKDKSMTASMLRPDPFRERIEEESEHDMRKIFIESYGVEMSFPAYYYSDAKFVPTNSDYILSTSWHIIPENQDVTVQTTYVNKEYRNDKFQDLWDTKGKNIILNLLKPLESNTFEQVKSVQLKFKRCYFEFSESGKYLAMFDQEMKTVYVYDSSDIFKCFQDIEADEYIMSYRIKDDQGFEPAQRILFDLNDKYLAIQSLNQIMFIDMYTQELCKEKPMYVISENYDFILDFVVDSKSKKIYNEAWPFYCEVACKQDAERKNIEIFNIFDDKDPTKVRNITYQSNGKHLVVKISKDFRQVVFSNGIDHFILNGTSQDFFPQIRDKTVRYVLNYNQEFYFITSKEYDRDVDILNSEYPRFNASIVRSLEPGQIKVFDAQIRHSGGSSLDDSVGGHLRILMNQGEFLYLDTIDIKLCMDDATRKQAHIRECIDKFYMAYGFNWPYFSYASKRNFIQILNAFNVNFIQRYELPKHIIRCSHTFLSDTHDFYCICETQEGYEIYNIDLDSPEPYLSDCLLKYSYEDVNHKFLTSFHVRSSSRKEKVNLNRSLIAFMMHGDTLYGWCQSKGGLPLNASIESTLSYHSENTIAVVNKAAPAPDCDENAVCSNFYYYSDDCIFYMTTKICDVGLKKVKKSLIKMVEAQFGNYKITDVYEDKDGRAEILNFSVDNTKKILLILTGIKNQKGKRDKFITLFDFDVEKVIFTMQVKDVGIIGRLKSNIYNFVGGHIYFNNMVIKIRYDLISKSQIEPIKENQVFDHYSKVLKIDRNQTVQTGTPFQTCLYNRLCYILRNQNGLEARKLLVLPYLHERRIYLNRRHHANQFYTLSRHVNEEFFILCLCVPDNKMYIYSETGILVERVSYADLAQQYGKPVEVSENGLILIFRRGHDNPEIHLIMVHIDKLEWVATIDVRARIASYLKSQPADKSLQDFNMMKSFYKEQLRELKNLREINMEFGLNDDAEILVRLRPREVKDRSKLAQAIQESRSEAEEDSEFAEEQVAAKSVEDCSFFYFFPNPHIEECRANCRVCFGCSKEGQRIENQLLTGEEDDEEEPQEFIYFDNEDDAVSDLQGQSMNQDYIFFWNKGNAWKLNTTTRKLDRLGIYVDEREKQTWIKQIRTGSNKHRVAIRISQTPVKDCVIIWDLVNDCEIVSYDVTKNAMFFQDRHGNQFLAENDYIINCRQTCRLKSYHLKVSEFDEPQFKFGNGYRFDDINHNYLLMRNFINLSFSYMTFVIKKNFDKGGYINQDFLFDEEGYDYVLKRNTTFTEGTLVTQDYDKLNFILQKFEELDPVLLEQLFYENEVHETPLHIAVAANNTRMVNLILKFLSKLENTGIQMIKNIFSELIDYQGFVDYLTLSLYQSVQMVNKQTLILKDADDEQIIRVQGNSSQYVDDDYFEKRMLECNDPNKNSAYQTFAVKVQCIRADWIINEDVGKEFLQAMLNKKNPDTFTTPYICIIIQFLYTEYSKRIMQSLLPHYILHLIFINLQMYFNEKQYDEQQDGQAAADTYAASLANVFNILSFLLNIVNCFVFFMQTKTLGKEALYRIWSITDFLIIICNIVVFLKVLHPDISKSFIRIVEAFLIILIWFKSLYFMRLVGAIAPLVDSIFVIMREMLWFLIIFVIGMVALSQAFYIIGNNQVDYQEATYTALEALCSCDKATLTSKALKACEEKWEDASSSCNGWSSSQSAPDPPQYSTKLGSLQHVYMSIMGGPDFDSYSDNPMSVYLYSLSILMCLIMTIHMLNMLIAIMGQSFDKNNEVAESNRKMSQLDFVVNNWWIDPIQDKKKIIYFIAAFNVAEEDDEVNLIQLLLDQKKESESNMLRMYGEIKQIQYEISQLQIQQAN